MSQKTWSISDLAKEFDITPRTLRYYEDHGILSPERVGLQRLYHPRDRTRLKLALRGKRMGFSLADIRSLIDMYDGPGSTQAQLIHYQKVLNHYKNKLQSQLKDLQQTLAEIEIQQQNCDRLLAEKSQRCHTNGAT
ncbi:MULTISPECIES: MerR family transcriptional regulator [Paenalcaligenes]|uniref:MerR family DNA-binding transcriptional regulator n=1 Tax=Paenalcaligenes hermetiae TaxID=1157987 RepID=A0ABP9M7Y7_9BURK|nr:MerR family DNA-binding transcriptional regulator [Paenalcaligenes sp.]